MKKSVSKYSAIIIGGIILSSGFTLEFYYNTSFSPFNLVDYSNRPPPFPQDLERKDYSYFFAWADVLFLSLLPYLLILAGIIILIVGGIKLRKKPIIKSRTKTNVGIVCVGILAASSAFFFIILLWPSSDFNELGSRDSIKTGFLPEEIALNPKTNMIYVSHGRNVFDAAEGIDVINGTTHRVVANISVPDKVTGMIVNPDTNTLYVTISHHKVPQDPDKKFDSLYVINGSTNNVTKILKAGGHLVDVALNQNMNTLYIINHFWNSFMALDLSNDEEPVYLSEFTSPRDIAVNSKTGLIYVTNAGSAPGVPKHIERPSLLYVINGSTNTIEAKIDPGKSLSKIAINPIMNKIYLISLGDFINGTKYDDSLVVVNGSTNSVIEEIDLHTSFSCIAVNSKKDIVYIANSPEDMVYVLDGKTNEIIKTISVGEGSCGIAINENTNLVYVANTGSSTISVINGTTKEIVRLPR